MSLCPKCRGTLELVDAGGVPLAVCASCRGIWLSESALAAKTGLAIWEALLQQGAEPAPTPAGNPYRAAPASTVCCVACGQPMDTVDVGPVQLERCRPCGGVFLDRGELVQLVATFGPRSDGSTRATVEFGIDALLDVLWYWAL